MEEKGTYRKKGIPGKCVYVLCCHVKVACLGGFSHFWWHASWGDLRFHFVYYSGCGGVFSTNNAGTVFGVGIFGCS